MYWWNINVIFDRGCLKPMYTWWSNLIQCIVKHSGIFCASARWSINWSVLQDQECLPTKHRFIKIGSEITNIPVENGHHWIMKERKSFSCDNDRDTRTGITKSCLFLSYRHQPLHPTKSVNVLPNYIQTESVTLKKFYFQALNCSSMLISVGGCSST